MWGCETDGHFQITIIIGAVHLVPMGFVRCKLAEAIG